MDAVETPAVIRPFAEMKDDLLYSREQAGVELCRFSINYHVLGGRHARHEPRSSVGRWNRLVIVVTA